MGAVDGSGALDRNRGGHLLNAEVVKSRRRHHDVDDGIDGADFVKMNLINQFAVDAGFGLGDAVKNFEGGVTDRRGERRFLEEVADLGPGAAVTVVMVVTMVMMMVSMIVGSDDEETGTSDPAADTAFGLEGFGD